MICRHVGINSLFNPNLKPLTHPKCRLINPTKSEVGRICKVKIDRIDSEHETKFYISLCSTQFRYFNHNKHFECGIYENGTELLKYVGNLKWKNIKLKIYFEVIKRTQLVVITQCIDRLYIKEATAVVYLSNDKNCLNKKSEFQQIVAKVQ